ncbi:IS66 family insertion sequence element accessory protein TnpB, partial [Sinorhizobium medicae]|nr:IS66 family insertion sequence element accessory protein TnpB [Sinorhizobium medicae]MDX0673922.1 IS66 family insertion sequence element accessory protein TnpB [Sinorhizobium medicae]MDX0711060.1 IS66 family insertion sequence element accessory protein TnpB [Sinorhizobium medicae]
SFRTAGAKDRQSSKSEKRMQNVGSCAGLIKVIWHDGQGACLFTKKLERGRFIWPSAADGTVVITPAQLGYLLEGIDWRMPQKTWRPTSAG